jgi:deoxyribose-phosphate aldolase
MENVAKMIDHTILKADTTKAMVEKVCEEAREYNFASVCVNSCYAELVTKLLKGTDIKTCCVVGFPLGAMTSDSKACETEKAIANGANEIDMVINVGALKDADYDFVRNDIKAVVKAAEGKALVKVILENCLLTDEQKVKACELSKEAGADFVKTSTGFSTGGATVADVKLMRETVGPDMGVKASGGVRTLEDLMKMKEAGASRVGASASVAIVTDSKLGEKSDY